ncbi:MAG: ABC transporter ATP-binding protein [Christensenellaceae bacterium]|nr:ABC transporter ATP-binding protein [Christensenellaceae bacterium]
MDYAIEINNISKQYKGFLLDKINLNIPKGSIVGLVGENGAGKSTLINLILGISKPTEGNINVLDCSNTSKEFTDTKQNIGVVLDSPCYPEAINVKQINNIMVLTYKNWDKEVFFEYIKKFKLPLDKKFKDFSKGMQMKLSLAVALSHKATLLVMDEPTSGLDPFAREEIVENFIDFTRDENNTIFISSHIISDLEKACDYIAYIHNGKLMLFEEKDAMFEKYGILKLSKKELETLPEDAIISKKENNFGFEVFVYRQRVNRGFTFEHASLEDIVINCIKLNK